MKPTAGTTPAAARSFWSPRWLITTALVIAAVAVMARLGFWQLDRLEERRAFNARVQAQLDAPALDLNGALSSDEIQPQQLLGMEYREVTVTGAYDPQNEIVLRNQVYENQPGYHLVTPLRIDGSDAVVLVNRGFIPMEDADPSARDRYARPDLVTVSGAIRVPHVPRYFGAPDPTLAPGETRLDAWNAFNLERIQDQLPYKVLPVYVQAAPGGDDGPIASLDLPEITEGSHLSYAAQWFIFASLLAIGYPIFVRKQFKGDHKKQSR